MNCRRVYEDGMRGLTIMFLMLCAACDRKPVAPPAPPTVRVLAVVYPLADIARRVGQEHAKVDWVAESGKRLESLTPDDEIRRKVAGAQVVISAGSGDDWVFAGLSTDARARRVLEPRKVPAAREAPEGAYLWLDPRVVLDVSEELRVRLAIVMPENTDAFRANAVTVQEQIRALDRAIAAMLEKTTVKKALVTRPVWGAFLARYGFAMIAPLNTPEEQLKDDDLKALAAAAREHKLAVIYVDATTPAAVKLRIERQTGLKALALDGLGSSAPDGLSTYEKLMRYNAEQLVAGQQGR